MINTARQVQLYKPELKVIFDGKEVIVTEFKLDWTKEKYTQVHIDGVLIDNIVKKDNVI